MMKTEKKWKQKKKISLICALILIASANESRETGSGWLRGWAGKIFAEELEQEIEIHEVAVCVDLGIGLGALLEQKTAVDILQPLEAPSSTHRRKRVSGF